MNRKLTPHLALFVALLCLLGFGIALDRGDIGTAIGAAIALSFDPFILLTAVVVGLWFKPYRQFLIAAVVAAVAIQVITSLFFAPHPVGQKLSLSQNFMIALRAVGFLTLAHLVHAIRTIFQHDQ